MSLDRPTFPTVRFAEGYDPEQVDLAVDMVRENLALAQPRIDRSEIERLRFAPVRMRPGYGMAAVDDWLDEVVAELDRRGGEQTAAAAPSTEPAPAYDTTRPGAVTEVQGGSTRLLVLFAIAVVVAVALYASFA